MGTRNPARPKSSNGGNKPKAAATRPDPAVPEGDAAASVEPSPAPHKSAVVVGIGASAGGLEALEELFRSIPLDSGMCFMVISHQHPGHTSLLPELLGRCTKMPVLLASDNVRLEPNHVYVGPPGSYLALMQRTVRLMDAPKEVPPLSIDYFFRSLADDQKERAICIVLSGTGTDGSLGLRAIKGEGGIAIVQSAESARYAGMPTSASATGLADFVLAPAAMGPKLIACAQNLPSVLRGSDDAQLPAELEQPLQKIFVLLRTRTGHDFSNYKISTMHRRVERRMTMHQIRSPQHYVQFLQEHPHELDVLFRELLISVTGFFRDPEAFLVLRENVLLELIRSRLVTQPFRAWLPGCSSGEEAYSMAITLRECMLKLERPLDFQVFATDLDMALIETARVGQYPEGIAADVPADLLQRYFIHRDHSFQVRREIRESVVFAPQNIIRDPPFTKLDLLCCRNLLIYLNGDLQKRLLPIFHYALRPGGVLVLGPSETIGQHVELFETLDRKWKIYRRKELPTSPGLPDFPAQPVVREHNPARSPPYSGNARANQLNPILERLLLNRFVPASVVVNSGGDILFIHGRTGAYLEPGTGRPRLNIHEMAREGLAIPLSGAMRESLAHGREVRRERLRVKTNGDFTYVDLVITSFHDKEALRGLLLVSFCPSQPQPAALKATGKKDKKDKKGEKGNSPRRIEELEHEVQYARDSLQTTVEQLETSNEELKSTNEELQSTNEELQSSNEELETSKEEMQSLNEELTTVNAELQSKVEDLSRANDDMQNLLNSTQIATLFLDNDLKIKRFTAQTSRLFKLIATDIGRPLADQASQLKYNKVTEDAAAVLRTLEPKQFEVETVGGESYLARIMPYRTGENAIDGVVITFVDITAAQRAEEAGVAAKDFFESIFNTIRSPALVLDLEARVVVANRAFYRTFKTSPRQTEQERIYELGAGEWDVPELHNLLEKTLSENSSLEDFELTAEFRKLGRRVFLVNARRLDRPTGLPGMVLLAMEDVTQGK